MREDIPRGALWTPDNGWTSQNERQCAKMVEEYDTELVLGQRKDTGEWVVFLKNGPQNDGPFPIFGLGRELPPADKIKERLAKHDVSRHGRKIYTDILCSMQREEAAAKAARHDADGQVAEAMEWGMRQMGSHPSPRIFVPGRGGWDR